MPDYTAPSRTAFSGLIVPAELYKAGKEEVKSNLAKIFKGGIEAA